MLNFRKVYLRFVGYIFVGILSVITQSNHLYGAPGDPLPAGLRLSTFDIDATPPVGSKLTYDPEINKWDLGLRARGIVILGAGQPIVLCAVDWIGIANEGQDAFRQALADAAGTIPERVAIHTVHQHDSPTCDFSVEKVLLKAGINPLCFEGSFARQLIQSLRIAVKQSLGHTQPITQIGVGEAKVYKVASNRRLLGSNGLLREERYSTCKDSAMRAAPEGLIDPMVSLVSFWNDNQPVAVLSYYATHPQSYYRTGVANPDFPGVARFMRQLAVPQALHIHFNGAGGNITAGKYNNGSLENRGILAERLADGMKRAWESTRRETITAGAVSWTVEPLSLPLAKNLPDMKTVMKSKDMVFLANNMSKLIWLERCKAGKQLDVRCLTLGRARVLFLPGEPFIEYQLAAKAARPDLFVAVAAYGDYAPGYICTAIAYKQGGYEAGPASGVTAEVEGVLMTVIRKLLNGK
jgi:hypothetical protein